MIAMMLNTSGRSANKKLHFFLGEKLTFCLISVDIIIYQFSICELPQYLACDDVD